MDSLISGLEQSWKCLCWSWQARLGSWLLYQCPQGTAHPSTSGPRSSTFP